MAANNGTFIWSLGDIHKAELPGVSFDPKECRIQCFLHIINTCVQHTVKALNNGIDTDIDDKAENNSEGSEDDSEKSDNEESASDGGDSDNESEGSNGEDPASGESVGEGTRVAQAVSNVPSDPLNKVRALVRGVRALGQRQEQFTNVILGGNQYGWWKDEQGNPMTIKEKQLLRDVKTHWDSTYQMLIQVWEFRQVSSFSDIA